MQSRKWLFRVTLSMLLGILFSTVDGENLRGSSHNHPNSANHTETQDVSLLKRELLGLSIASNQSLTILPSNGSAFLELLIKNTGQLKLPIEKKKFDVHRRLLFVAGLEGTGHHGVRAVFDVCIRSKVCDTANDLSRELESFHGDTLHGLFSGADVEQAHDQVQKVFNIITAIPTKSREERPAVVHIIGLAYQEQTGMMSYPNFYGKYKVMDHPDIAMLAYLCEMASVDFRVLVLQRPADEVIRSAGRRGFGGPRVLLANAEALYSQMQAIQSSFYHCLDYHTLGNMTEAHQLAFRHFVHPDISDVLLKQMLSKIRYEPSMNSANSPELAKLQYDIFQLQLRQQLMNSLCEKQHKKAFANLRNLKLLEA